MISNLQSIHRFRQSSRNCSTLPHNLKDDLSWPLRWSSHDECTSVYSYTMNMTYDESYHKVIDCHDSPNYYTSWTLNFERILSRC